jgi:hypothetical protein
MEVSVRTCGVTARATGIVEIGRKLVEVKERVG